MRGVFQLCTEFAVSNRALGTTARLGPERKRFQRLATGSLIIIIWVCGNAQISDLLWCHGRTLLTNLQRAERRQSSPLRSKEGQRDKYYYREKGASRGLLSCG